MTDRERILRFLKRSSGTMLHTPLYQKCQYTMNGRYMRAALDLLKAEGLIEERWDAAEHSYTLTDAGTEAALKALR